MKLAKKLFAFLFVIIVGLIVLNSTVFTHSHVLADGEIVTHAHPFKKSNDSSPFEKHKHSNFELFLIQNFGLFVFVVAIPLFLSIVVEKKVYCFRKERVKSIEAHAIKFGRAPPSTF